MNPSFVTDHLDIWTSAIEKKAATGRGSNGNGYTLYGIKKLRELILELAVRGKLVPQDLNDEPASVLLEKIAAEKERLIKEKKIKKQKKLPEINDDEIPFELPKGWEWVRLPEVYYSISPSGSKLKSKEIQEKGKYPVVDQGQSYIAGYTNEEGLLIEIPNPVVVFGDHTKARKYIDFNFIAGADGTKILSPILLYERFFYTYLLSYNLESRGYARHFKVLNDNLLALPPLAEQHRIVSKVDELMSLCDRLEQQTEDSIAAHQTLVETLLDTLTQSQNAEELAQNWNRISNHFDTLFTTEHSIDQLKQTILQLAVMGKLVSQDPKDEPASVLLEKIAAEKERLIKEGKIKRQKLLPEISDDEKPFDLPEGWEWVRVVSAMQTDRDISYGIIKLEKEPSEGGIPTLRCSDVRPRYIDLKGVRSVAPEIEEPYARTRLQGGEVLINIRGTLGGVALVPEELSGYNIAREVAMLPLSDKINGDYFVNLLASPFFWSMIEENLKGIAYKGLNLNILRTLAVPIPPLNEQIRIVLKVNQLFETCDNLVAHFGKNRFTIHHLTDSIIQQSVIQQSVA